MSRRVSALCRLFRALLLIKIHTLWQNNFKAKSSQVVWNAAEPSELQLRRAELLPDKQMMTHMGSSPSLFIQNSEEQSRDRFLCCQLKWLCAACCSVNQPHSYSLKPFLCGASSGFKKAKIIHWAFFLLSGKSQTAWPGVNARIHHLLWLLTSLFPWCTLTVA